MSETALYRLCTENQNQAQLIALLSSQIDGFTLIRSVGFWRGNIEDSVVIEIASTTIDMKTGTLVTPESVHRIARLLMDKNGFNQETVIVQEIAGKTSEVKQTPHGPTENDYTRKGGS